MLLIGVTDATIAQTEDYILAQGLTFPILAEAEATRQAWGVEMIWGNVVRLIDPEGMVVAESLGGAARILERR